MLWLFFFFNDTATTEIYTLSLHDALPIWLHALRARRGRVSLIAYADEANGSVGQFLTDLLRQGGDTVEYFRLWPMSGTLSYDTARATIARAPATVFVANVRPISSKGNIAL